MNVKRTDILQREDVKTMVDEFYDKVKSDELLGPAIQSCGLAAPFAHYVQLLVFHAFG